MNVRGKWLIGGWIVLILAVVLVIADGSRDTIRDTISGMVVDEGGEGLVDGHEAGESEVTEEEARAALLSAERAVAEMETSGLGSVYVEDLYFEARRAFDGENMTKLRERALFVKDTDPELALNMLSIIEEAIRTGAKVGANYSLATEKAVRVEQRKDDAYRLLDQLELLAIEIEETEGNVSKAAASLDEARNEFADERYDGAAALIAEAHGYIEEATVDVARVNAMLLASRRTVSYFIASHFVSLLITLLLLSGGGFVWVTEQRIRSLKRKIQGTATEQEMLSGLIKNAQRDYFQEKSLPRSMFQIKVDHYKEKITELKKKRPLLKGDLVRVMKLRRWQGLNELLLPVLLKAKIFLTRILKKVVFSIQHFLKPRIK